MNSKTRPVVYISTLFSTVGMAPPIHPSKQTTFETKYFFCQLIHFLLENLKLYYFCHLTYYFSENSHFFGKTCFLPFKTLFVRKIISAKIYKTKFLPKKLSAI